jgi:hypothetical protein
MEESKGFKHEGYFREYYIDGKFIGKLLCEKDRDEVGYDGRQTETTNTEITLDNKKKIKTGISVMTILYPLCGKSVK